MPTLNDLYYTFVGNINLEPEFTTQYDLGLRTAVLSTVRGYARWKSRRTYITMRWRIKS